LKECIEWQNLKITLTGSTVRILIFGILNSGDIVNSGMIVDTSTSILWPNILNFWSAVPFLLHSHLDVFLLLKTLSAYAEDHGLCPWGSIPENGGL
jgi:hypothetical protein